MSVVLRCQACSHERRCTPQEMLEILQERGMLRRETTPNEPVMRELLASVSTNVKCQECGRSGCTIHDDWDDEWTTEVLCNGCQKAIEPERLEIFPDTKLCPACQRIADQGGTPGAEAEFCPRCGGLMKLTQRGGAGMTRYSMSCGDCGYR